MSEWITKILIFKESIDIATEHGYWLSLYFVLGAQYFLFPFFFHQLLNHGKDALKWQNWFHFPIL